MQRKMVLTKQSPINDGRYLNYWDTESTPYMQQTEWACYFKTITGHTSYPNGDPQISRDCVYNYSTISSKLKVVGEVTIDLPMPYATLDHWLFPEAFFDWQYVEERYTHGEIEVIKILLPSPINPGYGPLINYVGFYNKENNILFTTDWSHTQKGVDIATEIFLPQLVEKLGLVKKYFLSEEKKKTRKKKIVVTVGTDPEFEVVRTSNGKIISADGERRFGGTSMTEEIGVDGAGDPLELRPKPGTPQEVVNNLHNLMRKFKEYEDYTLSVSGHRYALGGHIHIGVGSPIYPSQSLLNLLNDFIGEPTINLSGQARSSYKTMGAMESKPWGFEYRTPPAIIFQTKRSSKLFLKLARNLTMFHYKNEGKEIRYNVPCGPKEYMKIGGLTPKEVTYLFNKLDEWENDVYSNKTLYACWGLEKPKIERNGNPSISLNFRNDWNLMVKNEFLNIDSSFLRNKLSIAGKDISINFFGLSQDRGMITNFPNSYVSNSYSRVAFVNDGNTYNFHFGIPWEIRMNERFVIDNWLVTVKPFITSIRDFIITTISDLED